MSETLCWDACISPVGEVAFALSERGVVAITFLAHTPRGTLEHEVPGQPRLVRDAAATRALRSELEAYFAGELERFTTRPDLRGTPFQESVWRRLLAIPYGSTSTYGTLARDLGKPGASRAVGLANNRNRIGILVPCHRVVGADGALVGYGGGLDRKRFLLDLERRGGAKGTFP